MSNPKWPHLGASPDGIVLCSCCGKGALEIKCPYCHHEEEVEAVERDPQSCLTSLPDGSAALERQHAHYCQVQMQTFVCDVEYCDFGLFTFPSESNSSIHIERILPDKELWPECVELSTRFLRICILPELVSRPPVLKGNRSADQSSSGTVCSSQNQDNR